MTVARLRDEMSQDEWIHWTVYHGRKAQRQELEQKKAATKSAARKGGARR